MLKGYTGKILHVDLSRKQISIEEPSESFYRTYVGGSLLGLYYLWKFSPQGVDPLGADNTLTFAVSAAAGCPLVGEPLLGDLQITLFGRRCRCPSWGFLACWQAKICGL
ncbi:MAG: aldehyde ferredoxin oxidoreductase N-terminal domain-containing protein [Deinococcales bacterium]